MNYRTKTWKKCSFRAQKRCRRGQGVKICSKKSILINLFKKAF